MEETYYCICEGTCWAIYDDRIECNDCGRSFTRSMSPAHKFNQQIRRDEREATEEGK